MENGAVGKVLNRVAPKLHLLDTGKPGILSSDPEIDIAWGNDPLTNKKPMRVRLGSPRHADGSNQRMPLGLEFKNLKVSGTVGTMTPVCSAPEKTFVMLAIASATPSMNPTVRADAPSTETRKTGSSAWIISEEMSINMLTNPRTQTPAGMRAATMGDGLCMLHCVRRHSRDCRPAPPGGAELPDQAC